MPILGHRGLGGLGVGAGDAPFLFDFEFNTAYAAPLANPFADGIGILRPIQVDGQLSISGGNLVFPAQATPSTGDQGFYIEKVGGGAFDRKSGRVALFKVNFGATPTPSFPAIGLSRSAAVSGANHDIEVYFTGGLVCVGISNTGFGNLLPFATSTDYYILLWELTQGARALIKGGVYTDWSLLFDSIQGDSATLYPAFDNYQSAGVMDFVRGKDLSPDYQTDYANIPGLVRVTSSNQSFGSDLIVNGNMETGSPPSSWNVNVSASITAAADEHTGGSGTKSLQLTRLAAGSNYVQNSATVTQHKIYQGSCWLKNVDASVGVGVFVNGDVVGFRGAAGGSGYYNGTSWVKAKRLWRNTSVGVNIRMWINTNADGQSGKADDIEVKEVTVNTPITTPVATHLRLLFPNAASPVPGETIRLISRLKAVGEEFYNCFSLEAIRNDANTAWDVSYCRYLNGTRSIFVTGSGLSSVDGLYVIVEGNNHRVFSKLVGGNWSQRGTTIVDSNFNNATLANEVHTDGFSGITELIALPFNTGWVTPLAGL